MCGDCKKCAGKDGGYQVHITIDAPKEKILDIIGGVELVEITNYYDISSYDELITSQNFKTLEEASYEMMKLSSKVSGAGLEVVRLKIESNPSNNDNYLYREVHYKLTQEECYNASSIFGPLYNKMFFSKNSKGSYFGTLRFAQDEFIEPINRPHRAEDVIFDSFIELDYRLRGYRG